LTSLHLADMEFVQELPESLWGMAQLRNLALRNMLLWQLSAGVGALARLESLWLEELTIWSVLAELGQLTELKDFNMQLCIFCPSLPVEALLGLVGLLYLQIEWCKCPDEFGAWYLGQGYSSLDTEGVAVFQQLCAALQGMRALQTLTLRELQHPEDLNAVAQALRSPPPALRCVLVQGAVLERMTAVMYLEPTFWQLDSSSHLRHWRNEQDKVLAFARAHDRDDVPRANVPAAGQLEPLAPLAERAG